MRLDKEKINRLAALPDDILWKEIQSMLKKHGINLPDRVPSAEDMKRLRDAFVLGEGISPMEAAEIIAVKDKYISLGVKTTISK